MPDLRDISLRAGIFPTLAPFCLPEIAQRLAQSHPGIDASSSSRARTSSSPLHRDAAQAVSSAEQKSSRPHIN